MNKVVIISFISVCAFFWIYFIVGCGAEATSSVDIDNEYITPPYKYDVAEDEYMDKSSGVDRVVLQKKEEKKKKIVRYMYHLELCKKNVICYATCYSKEDGPVEAKGIYANQNFAKVLNRQERRIQRHHYTVALNYNMKEYHEKLIQIEDQYGNLKWTHKYRFHVPGYNKNKITDHYNTESDYFSVPRDRMHHKGRKDSSGKCLYCKGNRIDVLFTTAGNYATIRQRSNAWIKKNTHRTPVEIWEWKKYVIFSDGSKVRIE